MLLADLPDTIMATAKAGMLTGLPMQRLREGQEGSMRVPAAAGNQTVALMVPSPLGLPVNR